MARPSQEIKSAILSHLRQYAPDICRHWFEDIEPIDIDRGVLKLFVPEAIQLKYLQKRCVSQFTEAAHAATGHLLTVRFVGRDDPPDSAPRRSPEEFSPGMNSLSPDDEMILSPDFCFENFVSGPGNQLAHAASVAVAQKPGNAYNPLFIYSGVGLGKTHLLQAICQQAMRRNPSLRICYVSCEGFLSQFMNAVANGHMNEFRQRFRKLDMLLIDDIHDLSKRGTTQEEFFHTFNALYQLGKQIVLSSDSPPHEIPELEERLVSRFSWGLVTMIEKPCYETRVAIVRKKAEIRGIKVPDDVVCYIAAQIESNTRELEGALTKVCSMANLTDQPLTLELAQRTFGDEQAAAAGPQMSIQTINDAVTRFYSVKLSDLQSKRRHRSITVPRQLCMYLARQHTTYSLEEIGGYYGGRDHTTVMHAIRTVEDRMGQDQNFAGQVQSLNQQLRNGHG